MEVITSPTVIEIPSFVFGTAIVWTGEPYTVFSAFSPGVTPLTPYTSRSPSRTPRSNTPVYILEYAFPPAPGVLGVIFACLRSTRSAFPFK